MSRVRCSHCVKLYDKRSGSTKCEDCQKQFDLVRDKVMTKYAGAIKRLADR